MFEETIIKKLPTSVRIIKDAPMRDYTTFQLGGNCPVLIDCPDADALESSAKLLTKEHLDFIVIGQGSNLLVSDCGIDAIVLRYCSEQSPDVRFDGCCVTVSGNTLLDDLVRLCVEQGVGDIAFCSGIPGTVGGAIAGNAGAFGKQIGDVVESVRLMDLNGTIRDINATELQFKYRSSILKKTKGIILDAVLKLQPVDIQNMQDEREELLQLRRTKHPDWKTMPCAGSVFRNIEPTSAAERRQAAGWFLEEVGAKDFRVGGAHLFEKHANIIIAGPEATAKDVYQLTEKMIAAVNEKFGFKLEREIKLIGEFS